MKKIYLFLCAAALLALPSCDLFVLDNFDGPDASISGKIIDASNQQRIEVENGSLVAIEQGWDAEQEQLWMVKYNGEFSNDMVFSGSYRISTKRLPCFEIEKEISLKKGKNNVDFELVPFCRILDPVFRYDESSHKIIATFSVEPGDPSKANMISRVVLCASTSCFVGNTMNNCSRDNGSSKSNVEPGKTITLEIDTNLDANREEFKYKRTHYLRIGAVVKGNGFNNSDIYNYSPVYEISGDFSTIKEFNWSK